MNRKVKSVVNAAVAMGYGEQSDYHGNSVAEVLAEFATKAQAAAKLPAAAAADAGKVPTVQVAGGYALAAIPTELPAATASDEGKVLSVDSSGDYVLAEPGGEGGAFIINATSGVFDTSVSYNDILTAVLAGKTVFMHNNKGENMSYIPLDRMKAEFGAYSVNFDDTTYSATTADGALTMME